MKLYALMKKMESLSGEIKVYFDFNQGGFKVWDGQSCSQLSSNLALIKQYTVLYENAEILKFDLLKDES